jgi:hypothetical protein
MMMLTSSGAINNILDMDWFEKKAIAIQKKEVEGFLKEVGERQEGYIDEAQRADYDNPHDYEAMVTRKVFRIFAIGILIVITLSAIIIIL